MLTFVYSLTHVKFLTKEISEWWIANVLFQTSCLHIQNFHLNQSKDKELNSLPVSVFRERKNLDIFKVKLNRYFLHRYSILGLILGFHQARLRSNVSIFYVKILNTYNALPLRKARFILYLSVKVRNHLILTLLQIIINVNAKVALSVSLFVSLSIFWSAYNFMI